MADDSPLTYSLVFASNFDIDPKTAKNHSSAWKPGEGVNGRGRWSLQSLSSLNIRIRGEF